MNNKKKIIIISSITIFFLMASVYFYFVPNKIILHAWLGDRQSMYEAGEYYSFPLGDPRAYEMHKATYDPYWARYWFFRAAERGHPEAMYRISVEYGAPIASYYGDRPRWVPFDGERQSYWLNKAAENNSKSAIADLVRKYEFQPYEPNLFIKWAERGGNLGDMFCLNELTKAYKYGTWGVQPDPIKVIYWDDKLTSAARQHPYGQ